jgi:hypothetical protein
MLLLPWWFFSDVPSDVSGLPVQPAGGRAVFTYTESVVGPYIYNRQLHKAGQRTAGFI